MNNIKLSLCIPTKDRFDKFLYINLPKYIDYLNQGIIAEIVICDETGSDYEKIVNKYGNGNGNGNNTNADTFRIYKNDTVLGVFLNKLKVCNLANNNYIALIDSDNFADETYFQTAKEYICSQNITQDCILSPCYPRPIFKDIQQYAGKIFTKDTVKEYLHYIPCHILMNTGNFVLTKNIVENIQYDASLLYHTTACDVMYFNLLAFQQFPELKFHIVNGMEYNHVVHDDCVSVQTFSYCDDTKFFTIIPAYFNL